MVAELSPEVRAFIISSRIGRLATADHNGSPHVIPVCYVYDSGNIYTPLDSKTKRVALLQLKRVRNIAVNPRVALVIDRYSEDWSQLAYVLVQGVADLLEPGRELDAVETALREKYPQYSEIQKQRFSMLRIEIEKVARWGRL